MRGVTFSRSTFFCSSLDSSITDKWVFCTACLLAIGIFLCSFLSIFVTTVSSVDGLVGGVRCGDDLEDGVGQVNDCHISSDAGGFVCFKFLYPHTPQRCPTGAVLEHSLRSNSVPSFFSFNFSSLSLSNRFISMLSIFLPTLTSDLLPLFDLFPFLCFDGDNAVFSLQRSFSMTALSCSSTPLFWYSPITWTSEMVDDAATMFSILPRSGWKWRWRCGDFECICQMVSSISTTIAITEKSTRHYIMRGYVT